LDWRVVGSVTKEDELVAAKQSSNELCGPALCQVSPAKVGTGEDKLIIERAVIGVGDAAVEVNDSIEITWSARVG
jgi:hypothetical protein